MAVLAFAVGAVVASTGGDESGDGPVEGADAGDDRSAEDDELADALAGAGRALTDAGTFSYEATSHREGPDPFSLDDSIVVDRDMSGDVVLPDAVRQRVSGSDGVTYEHITIGSDVDGADVAARHRLPRPARGTAVGRGGGRRHPASSSCPCCPHGWRRRPIRGTRARTGRATA